jgi:hypothetical protein
MKNIVGKYGREHNAFITYKPQLLLAVHVIDKAVEKREIQATPHQIGRPQGQPGTHIHLDASSCGEPTHKKSSDPSRLMGRLYRNQMKKRKKRKVLKLAVQLRPARQKKTARTNEKIAAHSP